MAWQQVDSFQEAVQPVSTFSPSTRAGDEEEGGDVVPARVHPRSVRRQPVVLFADRPVFAHDLSSNREFAARL
jgi:hypothetical protein